MADVFAMVHLGQQAKLAIPAHHALKATKRLFGIPDFRYYAVADGIAAILTGRQGPVFDHVRAGPDDEAHPDMLDLFGCWVT